MENGKYMTGTPLLAHSHHQIANTFLLCLQCRLAIPFLLFHTVLGILSTFYFYILEITIIAKKHSDLLLYALTHTVHLTLC